MTTERIDAFRAERERLNKLVLEHAGLEIKRFFSLDSQTYREGALPARTKEMLGLAASLVLRCDDCILYHLDRCRQEGVTTDELMEVLGIGLVVGGSITIPHLRRAVAAWTELSREAGGPTPPAGE
jgi:AhpD family alkylhydroperoxidase